MVGRKPARYLAPIALVAAVVGTYLIVNNHLGSGSPTVTAPHPTSPSRTRRASPSAETFYTVQAGDSLTRIAQKTGVSIGTLEQLNQSLSNPNALQTGQRIRLRR